MRIKKRVLQQLKVQDGYICFSAEVESGNIIVFLSEQTAEVDLRLQAVDPAGFESRRLSWQQSTNKLLGKETLLIENRPAPDRGEYFYSKGEK